MSMELIDRDELLKILFPLGVPSAYESDGWDYCVGARAIYNAIMKCKVIEREEPPRTSIDSVGFSHVAYRAFRKAGITTVEEVLAMNRKQLLSMFRIGPKAANDIIEALEKQGYDCTKLKKKEDWRVEQLHEIIEQGYTPKRDSMEAGAEK